MERRIGSGLEHRQLTLEQRALSMLINIRESGRLSSAAERKKAKESALLHALGIIEVSARSGASLPTVFRAVAGLKPGRSKEIGKVFGQALGISSLGRKSKLTSK